MKYYAIIITVALVVVTFLYLDNDTDTGEIMQQNASLTEKNRELQQANDSIQQLIDDRAEVIEHLRDHIASLEDQKQTIHVHHEANRIRISAASDSELVRIIARQHSEVPAGY